MPFLDQMGVVQGCQVYSTVTKANPRQWPQVCCLIRKIIKDKARESKESKAGFYEENLGKMRESHWVESCPRRWRKSLICLSMGGLK